MTHAPPALRARLALYLLCGASLVVTAVSNRLAAGAFPPYGSVLASACVPSLIAALVLYLSIRPVRPFGRPLPTTRWPRVWLLSTIWLVAWMLGSAVNAVVQGGWFAYAHSAASMVCLGLIGPLQEELIFRGAIFEVTERALPRDVLAPLVVSTVMNSLYHLQLHGFHVTPFVAAQLAFTLPMGLVFARVRMLSGSVWPGFVLHVLTNAPHCVGSAPMGGV